MVREVERFQLRVAQGTIHCPISKLLTTKSLEQLLEDHMPKGRGIDEGITRAIRRGYSAMPYGFTKKYIVGCNTPFTPPDAKLVNELLLAFENVVTKFSYNVFLKTLT